MARLQNVPTGYSIGKDRNISSGNPEFTKKAIYKLPMSHTFYKIM
jgi:hypothetical protein